MTSSHVLFIPAVLVVGIVIGFIVGARSSRDTMLLEKKREEERKRAREERAKRKAAKASSES